MTNTGHFLCNGSSKTQFVTNIWYPFWQRLLRPAYVTFLKPGWWNSNAQTSGTFILFKKLFLVGLRGLQSMSNLIERPCIYLEFQSTSSAYLVRITYVCLKNSAFICCFDRNFDHKRRQHLEFLSSKSLSKIIN